MAAEKLPPGLQLSEHAVTAIRGLPLHLQAKEHLTAEAPKILRLRAAPAVEIGPDEVGVGVWWAHPPADSRGCIQVMKHRGGPTVFTAEGFLKGGEHCVYQAFADQKARITDGRNFCEWHGGEITTFTTIAEDVLITAPTTIFLEMPKSGWITTEVTVERKKAS